MLHLSSTSTVTSQPSNKVAVPQKIDNLSKCLFPLCKHFICSIEEGVESITSFSGSTGVKRILPLAFKGFGSGSASYSCFDNAVRNQRRKRTIKASHT